MMSQENHVQQFLSTALFPQKPADFANAPIQTVSKQLVSESSSVIPMRWAWDVHRPKQRSRVPRMRIMRKRELDPESL